MGHAKSREDNTDRQEWAFPVSAEYFGCLISLIWHHVDQGATDKNR